MPYEKFVAAYLECPRERNPAQPANPQASSWRRAITLAPDRVDLIRAVPGLRLRWRHGAIDQLGKPVPEFCEHYDLVLWQLTPTLLDRCFAGPGKRAWPTARTKNNKIDACGASGRSVHRPRPRPRPRHRGDFGLRAHRVRVTTDCTLRFLPSFGRTHRFSVGSATVPCSAAQTEGCRASPGSAHCSRWTAAGAALTSSPPRRTCRPWRRLCWTPSSPAARRPG